MEKDENFKDSVIESILEEYGKNASTLEIMEEALRKKAIILDFKEPDPDDMLDVEESEKIESDANLFHKYDLGIENNFALASLSTEATDLYENAIKFEYKGKEASIGFTETIDYYGDSEQQCCFVTLLMNIGAKDRLHISTIDSLFLVKSEKEFEKRFKNYEEKLDEYDVKNALRYAEYFSDRIPEIREEKYSFKYKLNNLEKDFLIDVYETYQYPFTLSFKFGVMCISSKFNLNIGYKKNIEQISYFIESMLKIVEEFMK